MQNTRQKLIRNGLDTESMLIVVEGKLNSDGEINYKYLVAPASKDLLDSLSEDRKPNSPIPIHQKLKSLSYAYNQGAVDITKEVFEDFKGFLKQNNSTVRYQNGCIMVKGVKRMYSHPYNNMDYEVLIYDDRVFDAMDNQLKDMFYQNRFYIYR